MGEILADFQKVKVSSDGGGAQKRAGVELLVCTAILVEHREPRAPDLNCPSLWVAASPSPSLWAVPCVGLVALIFS